MQVRLLNAGQIALAIVAVVALTAVPAKTEAQNACQANDPTLVYQASQPVFCGNQIQMSGSQPMDAYLGIQYAAQPVGNLRWQPTTQSPLPSTSTGQAQTSYGSSCLQGTSSAISGSESCLFLNVWTPSGQIKAGAPKIPVMVFIHGGAYVEGSGGSQAAVVNGVDMNLYYGANSASLGVVVVTLNYRLGALGFYGANFGSGGNIPFSLGIRDQQNAINWVIANIGIFGGDSSKITLFGESAGAMSVGLHTFAVPSNLQTSGQNKVLPWRAAIMESNPFASVYPAPTDPRETGVANAFLASICSQTTGGGKSCSNAQVAQAGSLSFLQNAATITPEVILTAQSAATLAPDAFIATGAINLPWTPVLDNTFITSQPLAGFQPNVTPIPVGFGVNQNEGAVFAGMALKKLGAAGVATAYQAEIDRLFGAKGVLAVEKIPRYNPALQPTPPSYATGASLALGNLITDYGMWCGNVYAMNNVVGQQGPVFGYLFSETPFTDLYNLKGTSVGTGGDNGACEPTASPTNVCHANELPYVFNNLGAVTRGAPLNYSPTQNDTQIAPLMNTAWVAFALNPSSPGPNWTPYQTATNSGGGLVGQWVQGQMAGNMTLNTGVGVWKGTPMCSGFWFTEPPYNGSSTSMGGKSAH